MYIKIEKIKFKNLLSYGNTFTEFEFKSGLNLIKAENGSGKSAIIDAISFVFFGKPYRNIKTEQLINNINEKGLEVIINFSDETNHYEMGRCLKPGNFWIKKNGTDLELLSSKRLNQDEINKIIGIDFEMFRNIVCVATSYNKSFLACNTHEKRTLVENIFNINVLADMLKEAKKRNSINKTKQKASLASYDGLIDNITTTTKFYKDVEAKRQTFDEDKLKKIVIKNKQIEEYKTQKELHSKNINISKQKEEEFKIKISDKDEVSERIRVTTQEKIITKQKLKDLADRLKTLSADSCPVCGTDLNDEHSIEYKNKLIANEDELKKLFELKSKNLEIDLALKEKIDAYSDLINKIKMKLVGEEHSKRTLEEKIKTATNDIKELETTVFNVDVEQYKDKIEELKGRKETLKIELDGLENTIEIDEHIIRILGDDGVRVYFFDKLLPILNNKVNYYLNKFELPISFEFDSTLNAIITRGRYEMSYEQFSNGERQRIDMSILLSFFDISKNISNWACSVLFLDEVLDSGVDQSGLANFLSVLNNIVHEENSSDIGIYLISHKLQETNVDFDSIVEVSKKQLFSEIKVTQ